VQLPFNLLTSSDLLPPSPRRDPILGVHLLYLLAENKIAEFHTQLELIPDHSNRYVRYAVELEQAKMEGRCVCFVVSDLQVIIVFYLPVLLILSTTMLNLPKSS
jgi:hypothetical protein